MMTLDSWDGWMSHDEARKAQGLPPLLYDFDPAHPVTVGERFTVQIKPRNERLLKLFAKAPDAFWRHDVDVSLDAAARMARIGQLAGVHGTYYILATGIYNPFTRDAAHQLNAIRSAGHRLGMHVDANDRDPHHAIDHAQRLFHAAYPDLFDLHRISFHMPTQDLLWRRFAGVASAYAPEWEGRYVSDSRGEWTPEKEALVSDDMQVALHRMVDRMTPLPRIIALLSWYSESPLWLGATITSIAPFVDHVVACDGAYALFPHGEAQSRVGEAQGIVETCQAAGLGLTLHRPNTRWFGNEVEKRTKLFQLAEQEAEANVDWYFVVDADVLVDTHPHDLKHQLAETEHDVAQVTVWERGDPYRNSARLENESKVALPPDVTYPIRAFFRATPGLHVTGNHYQYMTGDGRMLWGHALDPRLEPCLDLHNGLFRMEHRTHHRPLQRHEDAWDYYKRRNAAGVETEPGVVAEANERAKIAGAQAQIMDEQAA